MSWFSKKASSDTPELSWDSAAVTAIDQALSQAPVPRIARGQVKKMIRAAAEEAARAAGSSTVTAEHVMSGMLAKLPDNMRSQVESALDSKDPSKLEELKKNLGG